LQNAEDLRTHLCKKVLKKENRPAIPPGDGEAEVIDLYPGVDRHDHFIFYPK